jgi:hypothetical protein
MVYRQPDTSAARFICTNCWKTASSSGGLCLRCGVPQRPLTDEEATTELRAYVNTKVQLKRRRRLAVVALITNVIALAIYIPVGRALGIELFWAPHAFQPRWMPVNPLLFFPIWIAILVPVGIWEQRRHPDRDDIFEQKVPELLRLLGLRVEDTDAPSSR